MYDREIGFWNTKCSSSCSLAMTRFGTRGGELPAGVIFKGFAKKIYACSPYVIVEDSVTSYLGLKGLTVSKPIETWPKSLLKFRKKNFFRTNFLLTKKKKQVSITN
jgi:hypothetical protein